MYNKLQVEQTRDWFQNLKSFKSENNVVAIDIELTVIVHNLLFSLRTSSQISCAYLIERFDWLSSRKRKTCVLCTVKRQKYRQKNATKRLVEFRNHFNALTVSKHNQRGMFCFHPPISTYVQKYIYVIHRPGGPYWEKLYSRQRAQFFPIRTDQGR